MRFSSSVITIDLRSVPISTLSLASSNSCIATRRLPRRAASNAASLTRLARSAPEKPGVPRAITRGSTSGASGTFFMCTARICSRPSMSGRGTTTWRSKRPGRRSAGSSTSGRLVAAMMMIPSFASKPSISTSSWLRVCSRSSLPLPRPAPRWRPTASISSMKTMRAGDCLEGHAALLLGQHPRAALAEAHRAGAGVLLHLPHDEEADAEDQQEGQRIVEHVEPDAGLLFGLDLDGDALVDQPVGDVCVPRRGGVESLAGVELAADRRIAARARGDRHRADIALVHLVDELGIRDGGTRLCARTAVDHLHDENERQKHADPDEQALGPGVARLLLFVVHRSSFEGKTPSP